MVEVHDRTAAVGDGGNVKLAGVIAEHVSPAGSGLSERETVPAYPLTLVTVMVAAEDNPTLTPLVFGVIASAISSQYQR